MKTCIHSGFCDSSLHSRLLSLQGTQRETYERTEDSPFIRMQNVGSFALYKITTGQEDISAFVPEQEIKCLAVCDTATICTASYERPEKQLAVETQHPT